MEAAGVENDVSRPRGDRRGGARKHRKRVSLGKNFEALEFARSLGVNLAINLIADPDWDHERFKTMRDWCLEIPEIVNISVNTPYPGRKAESRNPERWRPATIDYSISNTRCCRRDCRSLSSTRIGYDSTDLNAGISIGVRSTPRRGLRPGMFCGAKPISSRCSGNLTVSTILPCSLPIMRNPSSMKWLCLKLVPTLSARRSYISTRRVVGKGVASMRRRNGSWTTQEWAEACDEAGTKRSGSL